MSDQNQINDAILLLKKIVKFSTLDGVKHLDLSVALASEREEMQRALMFLRLEIERGHLTEAELKSRLGLS